MELLYIGDPLFFDNIADHRSPNPADVVARRLLCDLIEEALSDLPPRQSHILRLRFGLGGTDPLSLDEIAARFDLSHAQIRALEQEALGRLRHPRLAFLLQDYVR